MAQNQMSYEVEALGWKNEEVITFFVGCIVLLMTFINLKQMSFIARFVMIVTVFVIAWTTFDAGFKFYIQSYMKETSAFNYRLPVIHNKTTIDLNGTAPVSISDTHTKSGFSIMSHLSVFKGSQSPQHQNATKVHKHSAFNTKNHFPYVAPEPHLHFYSLPVFKPFIPNFMDYMSQATGLYEGIPLLPSLYANSKNQQHFSCIVTTVMISIAVFVMLFAPLCVIAYGKNLREVVLLNLDYGTFETYLQISYALCLVYNIAINLFPIIAIMEGLRKRYAPKRTSMRAHDLLSQEKRGCLSILCQFLVSIVTFNVIWMRFLITFIVMFVSIKIKSVQLPFLINSVVCSNYFQIILPNLMIIKLVSEIGELRDMIKMTRPKVMPPKEKKINKMFSKNSLGGPGDMASSYENYKILKIQGENTTENPLHQPVKNAPKEKLQKKVMNSLIKGKNFYVTTAWIMIIYGIVCLTWGMRQIYQMIERNYNL